MTWARQPPLRRAFGLGFCLGAVLLVALLGATPTRALAQASLRMMQAPPAPVSASANAPGPGAAQPPSQAGVALPAEPDRAPGDDVFEVVYLKYADVSEVVGLLTDGLSVKSNDNFEPEEPRYGSPGGLGGSPPPLAAPAASNAPVGEAVDDTIAIDRRLNAIILRGSPERLERLKEKIAEIDRPVRSVMLDAMVVELDETGAKNVGIDFTNANSAVGVVTFQTGGFINGTSGQTLTSAALQAAIYAQVQRGHGTIVSTPRISAQSGGTAKIITGDAIPILTSIALSGVNAVSQQVQYVNVGVTLQIAPRISGDGFVTSHVFCVVSSVTGKSQGYPQISQREAETSATVRDGESFVIGGLDQNTDIYSDTRVPIAGDAPVVGRLFHLEAGSSQKTELYVVVTPHVLPLPTVKWPTLTVARAEYPPPAVPAAAAPAASTVAVPATPPPTPTIRAGEVATAGAIAPTPAPTPPLSAPAILDRSPALAPGVALAPESIAAVAPPRRTGANAAAPRAAPAAQPMALTATLPPVLPQPARVQPLARAATPALSHLAVDTERRGLIAVVLVALVIVAVSGALALLALRRRRSGAR